MVTSPNAQAIIHDEYDVVVAGAGNAGLVAALAAHDAGARVLVLEAAPEAERGGNSRFSGGIFRCAHDGLESLLGLITEESAAWADRVTVEPYPVEQYNAEYNKSSNSRNDPLLTKRVIDESFETVEWMADHGVKWELTVGKLIDPDKIGKNEQYALPPGGALRAAHEGVGLIEDLFAAVEKAGIDIWYSSPVSELVMDGNRCTGVVVQTTEGDLIVEAVTVLAAGGFEANPEMRQRWLGPGWDLVKVRGTRFNQGTVLNAAMTAGAQPEGHWGGCHAVPLDADAPVVGDLRLTDKMSRYSYPYALLLNSDCERFVDEGENEVWLTYAKTGAAIRGQQGAWAFQLFDAKSSHLLEPRYSTGTPIVADDLATLAEKVGVNAEALAATVEAYNSACHDGDFDPFTKDGLSAAPAGQPVKSNWAQRIDSPPFVVYPVTCGITFTYGGLKVDDTARVIDTANRVMGGLHATGELTGGFFYHNYPAGAGLMRGAVFGRLAGAGAAAEALATAATVPVS
ncbi:FAD-dependent tricarballylate dehydrogenase TcuA [Arthrobacter sp. 260]|uniref:FAD-dependent tricarballylate dehydrogenase TcuA n=1 Tax=Arthrobacter sp. 260 TaxID=2735314 RepID=UPI001490D239|nr:FAD-dependent tricarballylate dehydrogenase TcuA [Arthrobacter sp. 260]NOJ60063.1 FAD-dependent tricarballylate dehydrogenase TcuA [Arthrobacter sp. 260]